MTDEPVSSSRSPGRNLASGFAAIVAPWRRFWRLVGIYMPKRLYARSLLIIITPMILLQSVVAFVFMERHWQLVTQRLSTATVRDIAAIVDMIETLPEPVDFGTVQRIAKQSLDLQVEILPPDPLPPPSRTAFFNILDNILSQEITARIRRPFWIDTFGNTGLVEVRIQLDNNVLRVFARRSQAYASNTHIFLVWMVGTSLVLLLIAIPFLRNQIKPILSLAEAAESFGKGRPMPRNFRPRGAEEVRRAGFAFIQMRERIERQIEQRTAMLSGVSHDLRTILTRFRLQLAMIGSKSDRDALNQDIDDMQQMLEGYLAFARGEAEEDAGTFDMAIYLQRAQDDAELHGRKLVSFMDGPAEVLVRPGAFERLLNNVIGNAMRYARTIDVNVRHDKGWLTIIVDDDGPGIASDKREDVFKPFLRLDEARNLDASGTGLGLAIARDVARSHGGDITLDDSPMGGLRARIHVPA